MIPEKYQKEGIIEKRHINLLSDSLLCEFRKTNALSRPIC